MRVPCGADRVHGQVVHRLGSATGVGAEAAAVVPNWFVQVPETPADLLTNVESSVLPTLSVAEIHRLGLEDIERRILFVTVVLVRNSASMQVFEKAIGRTAPYWGKGREGDPHGGDRCS